METVSNLTGQPIVAILAGKQHKFRQLTLSELFGKFEAEVKNDWLARAHEIGNQMNLSERIEFLSYQSSHPLSPDRSAELVREKINSSVGVSMILDMTHIVENNDDVLPEIVSLMTKTEEQVTVRNLIEELTGTAGIKMEGKDSPKA